jgi:hypothetical protein
VARAVFRKTKDRALGGLLSDPRASAAAIHGSAVALIRGMKLRGIDIDALDAVEQAYRDLRNYAVRNQRAHHQTAAWNRCTTQALALTFRVATDGAAPRDSLITPRHDARAETPEMTAPDLC